jgi:hypothetical protein
VASSDQQRRSSTEMVRVQSHVILAADGVGCALVDLLGEQYYALNETGGRVWRLLAEGDTPAAIADTLAREYNVDIAACRKDVHEIVSQLIAWGLVACSQ